MTHEEETVRDLYDAGLAVQLAAATGDSPEDWDRAIAAWRRTGGDVDQLTEEVLMLGGRAADVTEVAEGSFAYACAELGDAARELMDAARPQWLVRLVRWLTQRMS